MSKKIKIKSVAFNLDDPDQAKMFEHATKRTNFSSYIKRLIQRDLEGGAQQGSNSTNDNPVKEEDKKFMKDFV